MTECINGRYLPHLILSIIQGGQTVPQQLISGQRKTVSDQNNQPAWHHTILWSETDKRRDAAENSIS